MDYVERASQIRHRIVFRWAARSSRKPKLVALHLPPQGNGLLPRTLNLLLCDPAQTLIHTGTPDLSYDFIRKMDISGLRTNLL